MTSESVVLTEGAGCALVKPQADAFGMEHVHGVTWQGCNQRWGLLNFLLLINAEGITRALGVIGRYLNCRVVIHQRVAILQFLKAN